MRDSLAEPRFDTPAVPSARPTRTPLPTLDEWLAQQSEPLADYWYTEVVRRGGVQDPMVRALLGEFVGFMASLVPASVSVARTSVLEVWKRTAALYGSFASLRGLAAGEVVEEVQVLREAVLRVVFAEPPVLSGAELRLREALRINRFVDVAVTQACVSHTDNLFFQLLEGNGVPATPRPDLLEEIRQQLAGLMTEAEVLRSL